MIEKALQKNEVHEMGLMEEATALLANTQKWPCSEEHLEGRPEYLVSSALRRARNQKKGWLSEE